MLSEVTYDLALDVTSTDHFRSRVVVRFRTEGGDSFLELHRAESLEVTLDGSPVTPAYDGHRIALDGLSPGPHEVTVDARLHYVTDGAGLHTFVDPVDGERYVGGYLGLDITQRLFACFDQLDLKGPITLSVTADPAWTVLSNGQFIAADGGRFEFAATPPIPCDYRGCVTFNESMLPRDRVTDDDRRQRAMVIAHEMSHMWFADLVSPVWWEDAWLNESFADYMGFEVAETVAGFAGARVLFEAAYKPGAYLADRRRSTHPVAPAAEDVPDVDTATTIFDAISYGKGNAVVRQLVTWLGEPDFLAGVNAHLSRHRFINATLEDLLSALDAASPRDVRGWAQVWLRQPGHDTIRVSRRGDVPVLTRAGVRPHRFTVTAYSTSLDLVGSKLVDLADEPVELSEWAGLVVVPNAYGETFARIELDPLSHDTVVRELTSLPDPLVRAVL